MFQNFKKILRTRLILKKRSYDRIVQQVTHEGGESSMKKIKRLQYAQTLSVSVGGNYSKDQLLHIFLDNFHQGGKYSAK